MGGIILEGVNYDYYEIASCDGPEPSGSSRNCKWVEAQVGRYISGNDKVTLSKQDLATCKKYCEDATCFYCESFAYSSPTFYLQAVDRSDVKLTTHASYTYYEMDCSGRCRLAFYSIYMVNMFCFSFIP